MATNNFESALFAMCVWFVCVCMCVCECVSESVRRVCVCARAFAQ
jgi:hypothetical protein